MVVSRCPAMASRAAASSARCVLRASSAFFSPAVFIAFGTVRHSVRTASSAAAMMSRRFLGSAGFSAFLFSCAALTGFAGFSGAVFFFSSTAGFGGFGAFSFFSCSFTGFSFLSGLGGFGGFGGFAGFGGLAFFFPRRPSASSAIDCVLFAGLSARPRSSARSCAGVSFAPSFDGGTSVSSISRSVEAGGVLPVMSLYIVALMA